MGRKDRGMIIMPHSWKHQEPMLKIGVEVCPVKMGLVTVGGKAVPR